MSGVSYNRIVTELRQRRHEQTKREIVSVALRLFDEYGYENVTMEQIAQTAGVSRSTLYRRFPTRDQMILEVVRRWIDVWDERRASFCQTTPTLKVIEACSLAVAAHIDEVADDVRIAYAAREVTPSLAAHPAGMQTWINRIVALLDSDPLACSLSTDAKHVIAGAYLGAINGMMDRWVASGNKRKVVNLTDSLLAQLRPIWPT